MSASTRPAQARRSISSQMSPVSRPQLRVIDGKRRVKESARTSRRPLKTVRPFVRIAVAIGFLGLSLVGSLMLRTQMVQDSFEVSQLQTSIGVLTQDVQDDQAKLDSLDSSLPQKAEKLGMQSSSTSVNLDLSASSTQSSSNEAK